MRLGIALPFDAHLISSDEGQLRRIVDLGRHAEELGFAGLWAGDSFGRGRPTFDPLQLLGVLCATTERIELGTGVLQVSLREPADLAHRVQTLHVMSRGRLQLGVGSGSTAIDFDVMGGDFRSRFEVMPKILDDMRRAWRGEAVHKAPFTPWPGRENGPPIILGAWGSGRWVSYAAKECQGWVASGLHSTWEDLEQGIATYRKAGGKRAIVTNVVIDIRDEPDLSVGGKANITLVCPPAEARKRLRRFADMGFDDVNVMTYDRTRDHLKAIRDLI